MHLGAGVKGEAFTIQDNHAAEGRADPRGGAVKPSEC